ncbi:RICIN domain-containing protein [Streptomyces europaeiscabiei]|uniref:RICIN domain-containing protein n=1 Tax=Streptomyces europaeiscabiei TaxID=146819 RepID=A0ABU4NJH5_9ACTN|nr:RICIN domain-containing protein [Streptomyces europaeiscabiei]MDX2527619.1 RICIN domain-containing protein [Streptomyces europaeiscabiei]MDX2764635.1 RICIN domain-containing protein [Streptomyces europaeiscabiei]MDX2773134.1 RICIN domain-containing protein [Streptomyces europaeiscabiei]MDX3545113.1 RICIN domain-containing protein [Streptomyces europaeiscabiei]MDX3554801.1 RICIN domain-containing protein [Streptomyces europaeiscabiei]
MKNAVKGLVLAGAAGALLAGGALPASAAGAGAQDKVPKGYGNVRLEKVFGTYGMCLSMDNSKANKADLKLRKCAKKATTQRWDLVWINDNKPNQARIFVIKNKHSKKCLYVRSAKTKTQVEQTSCNTKSKAQQWTFAGSTIKNVSAKKVLTAASSSSGQKITITPVDGSNKGRAKQEWGLS